ncbi:uncharacterized protein MYCGRDRAFT_94421 [Zymoseptoria tritici IPO323]|uniref:Uncharacterized protein n=1 Tax=Zymoseptoria tritici (strain CBS 115943 / IPO323) TaxID=336722 RepID=F9XFM2_ZYMTI|nr:uncharacterized protein MYCGRDRAFT_94421 [Zymoseptoria tritici IPO323]EGP86160.1 hypothetical protein MYCGRDRAFT_94421 [Zymoseptoria tritici IPO323]
MNGFTTEGVWAPRPPRARVNAARIEELSTASDNSDDQGNGASAPLARSLLYVTLRHEDEELPIEQHLVLSGRLDTSGRAAARNVSVYLDNGANSMFINPAIVKANKLPCFPLARLCFSSTSSDFVAQSQSVNHAYAPPFSTSDPLMPLQESGKFQDPYEPHPLQVGIKEIGNNNPVKIRQLSARAATLIAYRSETEVFALWISLSAYATTVADYEKFMTGATSSELDVLAKLPPVHYDLATAFSQQEANTLAEHKPGVDYKIFLKEGSLLLFRKPYRLLSTLTHPASLRTPLDLAPASRPLFVHRRDVRAENGMLYVRNRYNSWSLFVPGQDDNDNDLRTRIFRMCYDSFGAGHAVRVGQTTPSTKTS